MKLVIVESPTKAKTISRFLGNDFAVESSYGHIRDLPKSKLGIDIKHNFKPQYVIPKKSEPIILKLKNLSAKADRVILATDEDREGEAIAWHLTEVLDLNKQLGSRTNHSGHSEASLKPHRVERIVFHEITKGAVLEALNRPRSIDFNLVDAQQARRVLDRLVGYELSPFLWRKIRYGLSAGRVQSVALRLVVEREREIQSFKKEEYWTIEALFRQPKSKSAFPAVLYSVSGRTLGKMDIKTEREAKEIINGLADAAYRVSDVRTRELRRLPAAPFTTSTLQQEASRKFGFSAKQTMNIAQRLYENGFITYMRTDSVNLAESALKTAREVIETEFGEEYCLAEPRRYLTKSKGAQEAHEAIRPTNLKATSGKKLGIKDRQANRLYDLIWKRTIASQMKEAIFEQTSVDIEARTAKKEIFRAAGQTLKFDGFIRVYTEGKDNNTAEAESHLPKLEKDEDLKLKEIKPVQHFTEPPPRYTDATLVKALEANGVGRPSTYAPILSTIQERGYVEKVEKKYQPTEIGIIVNDLLVKNFPEIVDIKFTSHIEEELDEIAEGKIKWTDVCREFYEPFKKELDEKEATVEKHLEISDVPCPHCGKPMIIKFGRMGKFLACPEPGVKITLPLPEEAAKIKELEEKTKDERCPICGKPMKVRRGRFGFFLSCIDYPACKGTSKIWNKTGFKCPNCKAQVANSGERENRALRPAELGHLPQTADSNAVGDIVEKKSRGRPFWACTRYPECAFVMNKKPESEAELQAAFEAWKAKNAEKNKSGEVKSKPRKTKN